MRILWMVIPVTVLLSSKNVFSQFSQVPLKDLSSFRNTGKNWSIGGDIATDYCESAKIRKISGSGVLMNNFSTENRSHLYTREEWGDIELELEFMMFKGSNSGIYLQGRYEIQLLDSWKVPNPSWSDAGAIYSRYEEGKSYEGTAPVMNVAKAPGLWQTLHIKFHAPQFDNTGKKIKNARFESVALNGVVIIRETEVTGCTRAAMFEDERPKGPLVFQGDHGPVAFRNIRYRDLPPPPGPEERDIWNRGSQYWKTIPPVIASSPGASSIVRTFLNHKDKKLTHALSVSIPGEINYSYDLKQGSIFQIWRGQFLDVTAAWWDRGWLQLGVPMGAVISLDNAPVAAMLKDQKDAWPDSLAFDQMHHEGYVLKKDRMPVFRYSYQSMDINDEIKPLDNRDGLKRTLTISGNTSDVYCRIATGKRIERLSRDLYAVDDKSYYIQVGSNHHPVIRKQGDRYEIIIKYLAPLSYNMVW